jgi:hypothetical protein
VVPPAGGFQNHIPPEAVVDLSNNDNSNDAALGLNNEVKLDDKVESPEFNLDLNQDDPFGNGGDAPKDASSDATAEPSSDQAPSSDTSNSGTTDANSDLNTNNNEVLLEPEHTNNDSMSQFPVPKAAQNIHNLPLDAHNQIIDSLTSEQCDLAFPGLFQELERSKKYWELKMHQIGPEDLDITWRDDKKKYTFGAGAMRILIHDNQVRIVESREVTAMGFWDRGTGLLRIINRALESASRAGEILPTIEASIVMQDISDPPTEDGTHSFWTFTRRAESESNRRLWVAPNWDMIGWYFERKRTAIEMDAPFTTKIQKLVWRGTEFWNPLIRSALLKQAKGKPWADVFGVAMGSNDHRLPHDGFCEYAMTMHTEGVSYSDRLEYLLNCNSLTFVHKLNWTTHFSHLLKGEGPDQNVVMVERDFTDLPEKAEYYLSHPEESEKIIANAVNDFRRNYLSRAATSCYTRRLIQKYSEVSFTPEVNLPAKPGHVKKRRGLAYEDFIQWRKDVTDEGRDPTYYMLGD